MIKGPISLRARLVAFIEGLDVKLSTQLSEDTSLIQSGLFDSMALVQLAEWIEREIGCPLDPMSLDLSKDWDTVPGIVNFVERRKGERA